MTEAIDHLAKVCSNIIKAQGLSHEQEVLVGAKIIGFLSTPHSAPTEKVTPARAQEMKPKEDSPPPEERPIKVIARKGLLCSCSSCSKNVYQIVSDITDPMPTSDFINAFAPIGHEIKLTRFSKIQNINGAVSTDCPLCQTPFSLWLIGQGSNIEIESSPDGPENLKWE